MKGLRAGTWLACCLSLLACKDGFLPDYYGPPGLLPYACLEGSDPQCDGVSPAPGPGVYSDHPPVGLDARFDVTGGQSLAPLRLAPLAGGGFRAEKLGLAAMASRDGSAVDLVHLEVREPVDISVTHETQAGLFTERVTTTPVTLSYPEDRFRALLIDERGDALIGSYPCEWTSTNPDVIRVVSDPGNNVVTFRIEGSGQATLRIELGDFSQNIDFNVTIN